MLPPLWITQASERIKAHITRTPLEYDARRGWYLKWENQQRTGSFKVRGALNKVLSLQDWELAQGLVTASAGNHGQGVALAGKLAGAHSIVYAAEGAVETKVAAMRALGAEVRLVAGGYHEAESAAREHVRDQGGTFISAYNDGLVVAGQATLAAEIMEQLDGKAPATWLVPVGGGGLISGIAAAIKTSPETPPQAIKIIGVQSEASPFMHALFYTGSQDQTKELPGLTDGLSGPVEADSITIPLIRKYVDRLILVEETAIREAIRFAWNTYAQRIEGSAAVVLAALLSHSIDAPEVVAILTGGNIQPELHTRICRSPDLPVE